MQILQILKNSDDVLGQNARNLHYIKEYSNPLGKKIADDKLLSKKVLIKAGIAVPELIGIIKDYRDLTKFDWDKLPKSFVMKPVHGSQGGGIEIFYNKDETGNWIRSDGTKADKDSLIASARDILDGKFSLHNEPDQVFFEARVRSHGNLKNYCYKGVPDIRIVVFNKIPIMAYVRFPTKESKGKANMILGAVGTGIDLSTGITTTSTYGKANNGKGEAIEFVPGTGLRYQGLKIPYWDKILASALKTQEAVGLKFMAIDFLIDEKKGPMIVEVNARPGLSIQIVNREGLGWRLNKAKGLKVKSVIHGIRLGKDLFGGQIEEQIEKISGKEIISNIVPLKISKDKFSTEALALIDTSRRSSIIEQETARKLKLIPENFKLEHDEYLPTLVKMKIGSHENESEARIVPDKIKGYKVVLGRNDLTDFIIDIKKTERSAEQEKISDIISSNPYTSLKEIDTLITEIKGKVNIIPALRPINLAEEKQRFFDKNFKYNPIFFYKPLKFNPDSMLDKLEGLRPPEDEIGEIYRAKITELKRMIYLLNDVGNDPESFTRVSGLLYGDLEPEKSKVAEKVIANHIKPTSQKKLISIDKVVKLIQTELDKYGLKSDIIISDNPGRTRMSVSAKTGKIILNKDYQWDLEKIKGTIAHEILTHLIRLKNANTLEYKIMSIGTAKYFKTEEGLATIMKYTLREKNDMFFPALSYKAIKLALNNDFKSVFHSIVKYTSPDAAWKITYRVKRGLKFTEEKGAFMKDQYFGWAIDVVEELLENPELLKYAFNGKASLQELAKFTQPQEYNIENLVSEKLLEFLEANS